jgi:hypothetical protein
MTITATSVLGDQLSTQTQVHGVITTREALESLFTYPLTPVVTNAMFAMTFTNLTQGCGDGYSIALRDPANTTTEDVANNVSFSGSSSSNGYNPIVLQYTTDLGTVYSDDLSVSIFHEIQVLV